MSVELCPKVKAEGTEAEEGKTKTEIDALPNELLESILSFFCTETLEKTLSEVCTRWKGITEQMISRRVANIPPETLTQLKTHVVGNYTDVYALKMFERMYMAPSFRFQNYTREHNRNKKANSVVKLVESCASDFRNYLISMLGDSDDHNDEDLDLHSLFKPIPCHRLIVVRHHLNLRFYHESIFWTRSKGRYRQYEVEMSGNATMGLENGAVLLDVYHDKVAVYYQTCGAVVVLYQITDVCHSKRKVSLREMKKVCSPETLRGVTLYKDKIYLLDNNWYIGVWNLASDSVEAGIQMSQQEIPIPTFLVIGMASLMCRVNNLLFIKLSYSTYQHEPWLSGTKWMILDMNEDCFYPVVVPMEEILTRVLPVPSSLKGEAMFGIQISGNVLLFHAIRLNGSGPPSWKNYKVDKKGNLLNFPYEDILLAFKFKLDPKKEDFLDMMKFSKLIDGPSTSTTLDIIDGFSTPLPSSCFGTPNPTFLGISNNNQKELGTRAWVTTVALRNLKDDRNTGQYIG